MPETLPDHIPSPRTPVVWDGTRYRAVRGHTDGTVQVRGEDQLHSYRTPLCSRKTDTISGAGGSINSDSPADGDVWHITHVTARDATSPITAVLLVLNRIGVWGAFGNEIRAIGANEDVCFKVELWLEPDDFVQANYIGALANDTCFLDLIGEVFTKE